MPASDEIWMPAMPASPATAAAASIAQAGRRHVAADRDGRGHQCGEHEQSAKALNGHGHGRGEQDEQGEPQEGRPQPEGGRAGGIERGGGERSPERHERSATNGHEHRGGHEVAAGHPERIAEQQLLKALRRVGSEGEQRPEADEPGDRDGCPGVGGDIRVARGERDQRGRDDRPARGAEQQRRPGQPGQHQAGQQAVRERLSGVGQALAHDPEAESAAEPSGEHELEHGAQLDPAHDEAVSVTVAMAVLVVVDGDRPRGARLVQDDQLAAVGLLERLAVERRRGRAERDLAAVEAEHEIECARSLDVVARHEQRPALGAQLAEQRLDQLGARGIHPGERLVEQEHPRVLHQGAREQRALALAARQLAEVRVGLLGEADPFERAARGGSLIAAGGSHQRPFASAPMSATSRALTGKSRRVRSVWATYAGRPVTCMRPAAGSSSPVRARKRVVLPPPFGPSTQTVTPGSAAKLTPLSTTLAP